MGIPEFFPAQFLADRCNEIIFINEIKEAAGNIHRTFEIEKLNHPERAGEIDFLQKRLPIGGSLC